MAGMITKAAEGRKEAPVTAVTQQAKPQTLQEYIQRMSGQIKLALPANLTPDRFQRIVMTAVSSNPKLQECTHSSFLGAMMTAAQLGLEPNTPLGQSYLIPRKTKKGDQFVAECTFQLGYRGLINLAYRSGEIVNIGAFTVYQGDEFHVQYGLNPDITHVPAMTNRGEPIAYYAYYRTKDGGYGFDVMSVEDVNAHARQFSESVKRGWTSPWDTNFDEMAKKTVLKRALKYAPLSTEVASNIRMDETVHDNISAHMTEEPIVFGERIDADTGEVINAPEEAK